MRYSTLQKEVFQQIDQQILNKTIYYLGIDSTALEETTFQNDVSLFYTEIKKALFTNNFWNFSRVHNFKLTTAINPITGIREKILPPDFLGLILGFDKQSACRGSVMYSTSLITTKYVNLEYINYIRYVYDNDGRVQIPDYFKSYVASRLASQLILNNKWQTTSMNAAMLETALGTRIRPNALNQNDKEDPFTSGIDYMPLDTFNL